MDYEFSNVSHFWNILNNAFGGNRRRHQGGGKRLVDGFMAVGPHIWWEPEDPEAVFGYGPEPTDGADPIPYIPAAAKTRYGWGVRFGFGGSYQLNKQVQTYVHFGYMYSVTHDEDVTIGFQSFPFGFGLRNQF